MPAQVAIHQSANGKEQEDRFARKRVHDYQYVGVFDGHGGDYSARWCRDNLHKYIEAAVEDCGWPENCLHMAFSNANRAILLSNASTGTTASVFLWRETSREFVAANVGDSTIVLCQNGVAKVISYDHNCREMLEHNRLASETCLMSEDGRIIGPYGGLAVTRTLGDLAYKPYACAIPFVNYGYINNEDEFVIIASDGLWDVMTPQDAVAKARNLGTASEMASELVEYAIKKSSRDNITCGVVLFRPPREDESNVTYQSIMSSAHNETIY
ncbi:Protein phosphatase 2C 1 [Wickerhamiella sorbophila]|uniref:Protein phosphatase 2C 1 n=1 Tax=Wickerhamiella sorbophila TaxID=45607 RepID=A0A2T0FC28_9ASCO|nr:Protein phosphatase 2C 1 [Wickerhamiella sorbophila]PRT52546.1 Protein phosphatase 2C 1 [Wickerhamiella sorbophila]